MAYVEPYHREDSRSWSGDTTSTGPSTPTSPGILPPTSNGLGLKRMLSRLSTKSNKNSPQPSPNGDVFFSSPAPSRSPSMVRNFSNSGSQEVEINYFNLPKSRSNSKISNLDSPSLKNGKTIKVEKVKLNNPGKLTTRTNLPVYEAPLPPTPDHLISPVSLNAQSMTTGSVASRFLRRVASAPNAKGLFNNSLFGNATKEPPIPFPASSTRNGFLSPVASQHSFPLPSPTETHSTKSSKPLSPSTSSTKLQSRSDETSSSYEYDSTNPTSPSPTSLRTARTSKSSKSSPGRAPKQFPASLTPPLPSPTPSQLNSPRAGFRRTYSSNSIKVRSVEVGPSSFQKIKLLGKGDVGKVYLVREKKSEKLFAMKGKFFTG